MIAITHKREILPFKDKTLGNLGLFFLFHTLFVRSTISGLYHLAEEQFVTWGKP